MSDNMKHAVKRYFDTYYDGFTGYFDTEEQAVDFKNERNREETRHKVTWEYRGLEEPE